MYQTYLYVHALIGAQLYVRKRVPYTLGGHVALLYTWTKPANGEYGALGMSGGGPCVYQATLRLPSSAPVLHPRACMAFLPYS